MKFLIFLALFAAVLYVVAATEIDQNEKVEVSYLNAVDLDPGSVNHQIDANNRAKRYASLYIN